ncbi:MAG TPA: LacI family DNA-binding transcriptional regulator [Tepidisphaeraceae bacterium]|jgi:DNA-binding LacI/PurR family transcriptional regulator|nr:LacI family DNA-binding transcriptional regulator [Tepidisphaeraceae bacterium]
MSIIQVAEVAGVSKSTVSRVINQSPAVAPEATKAVHEAMQRLGYSPPLRRRGPKPMSRRGIRTGNIALLVMGLRPADLYRLPVFPSLLHGIERALAEQQMNLVLANFGKEAEVPAVLAGNQTDGVLLFGKWDDMPNAVRARLKQLPLVWVMREHSDIEGDFDHVFYNNAAVGPIAARYLLSRGHKRLAYLSAVPKHTAFAQRQHDFTETIQQSGASVVSFVGDREIDPLHWSAPEYLALVDRLLEEREKPTGLFVATDAQLPGFYHALLARGLHPEQDVHLIGCDNEQQFLSQLSPAPATIDINLELVGHRAVQQLLWRIRNPEEKNRISLLVEPRLITPQDPKGAEPSLA